MIYREISTLAAAALVSLSFVPGTAVADTIESAHNALCMRLGQTASTLSADPDVNDPVKEMFEEHVEYLCASPTSVFGHTPVSAAGRETARACFRSLTVLQRYELLSMDMATPQCSALFKQLQG